VLLLAALGARPATTTACWTDTSAQVSAAQLASTTPGIARQELQTEPGNQLADEILRRLRRLGFRVTRNPLARPPERIGELC
jgi:hypothetical protein